MAMTSYSREFEISAAPESYDGFLRTLLIEMGLPESLITPELLEVADRCVFDKQSHTSNSIAATVSEAFYGEKFEGKQAIVNRTAELKGVEPEEINDITQDSGFDKVYQMPSGLSEEQYMLLQQIVARELTLDSLRNLGAAQPDLFLVATSVPTLPYFEKQLGAAAGVANPGAVPKPYLRACDSSGAAAFDLLTGRYDDLLRRLYPEKLAAGEPCVVTIFAIEDAFRLGKGGDEYSAQVFSTAAVAWSFLYHPDEPDRSTFKHIVGGQASVAEGAECLQYYDPTVDWPEDSIDPRNMAPHLTRTTEATVLMDPKMTPLYFRNNAVKLVTEVWGDFKVLLEEQLGRELQLAEVSGLIKKVIVHHPSKTIFNHLVRALVGNKKNPGGLGFKNSDEGKQIQWVINEGNAPSTTVPIAFGRQLHELEPDDYVILLSYGAGGGFTCQVVQINGRN